MIEIDKEELRAARVVMDAHRWTLSEDSQTAPKLEFLSTLCRRIYFALEDNGEILIKQKKGGNNGANQGGETESGTASSAESLE